MPEDTRNREYWKFDFVRDGKQLTWEEAMAHFRDAAGRPGPKDWIQGEYPKGQDDYPVDRGQLVRSGGVRRVCRQEPAHDLSLEPRSGPDFRGLHRAGQQFRNHGRFAPRRQQAGVGPWGTYDMAGNVKEWIWTGGGVGQAIGSGWRMGRTGLHVRRP